MSRGCSASLALTPHSSVGVRDVRKSGVEHDGLGAPAFGPERRAYSRCRQAPTSVLKAQKTILDALCEAPEGGKSSAGIICAPLIHDRPRRTIHRMRARRPGKVCSGGKIAQLSRKRRDRPDWCVAHAVPCRRRHLSPIFRKQGRLFAGDFLKRRGDRLFLVHVRAGRGCASGGWSLAGNVSLAARADKIHLEAFCK